MTFLQPLLLTGLLLTGLPVVLHLIMQQKPKRLPFPAFRFLAQKQRTNTRRLRLRHLLLLLLRMLIIACLCLALARPKVLNDRFSFTGGTPLAVALVIDTSLSMEYRHNGKTRLEDSQQRARELLDELPAGSRVAVLDSGEPGSGEWLNQPNLARDRVAGLQPRPNAGSLADALLQAYRLLAELDNEADQAGDSLPRSLYVFSDRTQESWDASRLPALVEARDRLRGKLPAVFVDVGVEEPVNIGLGEVEVPRQRVPANQPAIVKVSVQAVGQDIDTEVRCRFDNDPVPEKKPVRLRAGQAQAFTFERPNLPPGTHQAEITLATSDNLPADNARFATVEVASPRRVLTIADDRDEAAIWGLAIDTKGTFKNEVIDTVKAAQLTTDDLAAYQAVALFSVANPASLWGRLTDHVKAGGGLVIVPGGEELKRDAWTTDAALALLPGTLVRLRTAKDAGVAWNYRSAVGPLKDWPLSGDWEYVRVPPRTTHFWEVQPAAPSAVAIAYEDERPALLDRALERGRVLLFTTPLDLRRVYPDTLSARWNDYATSPFYQVIVNEALGQVAGADRDSHLNFRCGEPVQVVLPSGNRAPSYLVAGPGMVGQASSVPTARQAELAVPLALLPGNYQVRSGDTTATGFSLNVAAAETNLVRVPVPAIEALLGPKAVLPIDHAINLKDALQGHWGQPIELFPTLMVLLLLALAAENLLANRFYRRPTAPVDAPAVPSPEANR